jgi:hypothetical protein
MVLLKPLLLVLVLVLLLAVARFLIGNDQRKDAWADLQATCASLSYSNKSLELSRTYLFGFIPLASTAVARCTLPPLSLDDTMRLNTKSSK